jgi:alkanesulfonate monooxygenase SsuD/methylene tetrahydromethanopterin reductase-like flavin-dependent oxidoreductase (luciferase family)
MHESHNRGYMSPDPFVVIAIAAAVTSRVELGTAVVQAPLRSPFWLANQVGSVARAAGGRFALGVGAGSAAVDFKAFGLDFSARFKLLEENIGAMRRLLAGDEVGGGKLSPGLDMPAVPVLVGAWGSGRWLRKAATEYDGWISSAYWTDFAQMIDGLKRFRDFGGTRAVAANVTASRPDAGGLLAQLAGAGFDEATMIVDRFDHESLESARRLWPC